MIGADAPRKRLLPARQLDSSHALACCAGGIVATFAILLGMLLASAPLLAGRAAAEPEVDFHFQMLNISTPRQGGKLLNLFIKFRYQHSAEQCPFSAECG